MPTATVYANRVAIISPDYPTYGETVDPDDFTVGWRYPSTASQGRAYIGLIGFNVPQSLWDKQAISVDLIVPSSNYLGYEMADAYPFAFKNPNDFNANTITWKKLELLNPLGTEIDRITFESSGVLFRSNRKSTSAAAINCCAISVNYHGSGSKLFIVKGTPYIKITYSDNISIFVTQDTKNLGYVDPKKTKDFNTAFLRLDIIGQTNVTAAKIKWRKSGTSSYTETNLTVNGVWKETTIDDPEYDYGRIYSFKAPANIFPTNSTIEYQIQMQVNGKWWSNNTKWGTFSTVDAISTATPISPDNSMIDVESANVFKWKHNISTGSTPTGYDLQYSTDGHSWLSLFSNKSTSSLQYTVPANKLPAGKLWWRVRTYNGDGIAGEWSNSAAIVGYGAPPTPTITNVSNTARPTVTWTSSTQIAYDLGIYQGDIEILRTGETAGTAKTYISPDFLEDGTYTAKLRIENSGLYWSKWATKNFTIRTSKPAAPSISGKPVKNGVIITTNNKGNGLFLLRDEIPIAKMINGQAEDYAAVGWHEYKIRLISGAAFSDSVPLMLETKIEQAIIASADNPKNMIGPLLQSERNAYPSTSNIASEMLFYAGRKYPVAVTTDDITEQFSPTFAALTPSQYEQIKKKMENSTVVIYRNSGGDCAYCLITNISPSRSKFYTSWEMTLSHIDYIERIDYDGV